MKVRNTKQIFLKTMYFLTLISLALSTTACIRKKVLNVDVDVIGINFKKAYFVTPTGKSTNDGSSWQNSLDLQTAINKAEADSSKKFVLVAQGSYFADANKTDITKTFILKTGVKIYGGFDTATNQRDFNSSILEGDMGGGKNTKLLIKGENLSSATILDGFVIQNALNSDTSVEGAGMYLKKSSPLLNNLTFKKINLQDLIQVVQLFLTNRTQVQV